MEDSICSVRNKVTIIFNASVLKLPTSGLKTLRLKCHFLFTVLWKRDRIVGVHVYWNLPVVAKVALFKWSWFFVHDGRNVHIW